MIRLLETSSYLMLYVKYLAFYKLLLLMTLLILGFGDW